MVAAFYKCHSLWVIFSSPRMNVQRWDKGDMTSDGNFLAALFPRTYPRMCSARDLVHVLRASFFRMVVCYCPRDLLCRFALRLGPLIFSKTCHNTHTGSKRLFFSLFLDLSNSRTESHAYVPRVEATLLWCGRWDVSHMEHPSFTRTEGTPYIDKRDARVPAGAAREREQKPVALPRLHSWGRKEKKKAFFQGPEILPAQLYLQSVTSSTPSCALLASCFP